MALLLQTIFSSLINGSVFALMGVGIVLCYRSSGIVNLAQGETFMISGILTAKLVTWGVPLGWAGACGIVAAGLAAILFERVVLRSRLHWPPERLIIVTVGVAFLAEGVADRLVGANQFGFANVLNGSPLMAGEAAISQQGVLLIAVTLVIGLGLVWFFRRTLLGQAMTASAENPSASSLLGVNVPLMRQLSFGLAGVLGGIAAFLLVPTSTVTYNSGLPLTLNGFAVAAFAQMTHPGRALLGGLALALGEGLVGSYLNPALQTPLAFGVLLVAGVAYLARSERFAGARRA
jgi:branched-subunit amino acid ABC-type transport system permease component